MIDLGTRRAHRYWDVIAPRPSQRTEQRYAHRLIHIYIHLSINKSLCNHLYLYYAKHEFTLKSPTLIHHHMDPSLLPLFICKFPSNSEKSDLPSTYLMVPWQPPDCDIRLWIRASTEATLPTRVRCSWTVPFAFSLTDTARFQSCMGQQLLPLSFTEVVSHICMTVRFSRHKVPSWERLTT